MKIGIVVWDLSVSGGTQRQAIELARHLSRDNEVTVFSYGYNPERCYPDLVKDLNVRSLVRDVPKVQRPGGKYSGLWFDMYSQFHVADEQIKELAASIDEPFDVLNIHDLFTERVAYYYRQRFPQVKAVWMSNDVPGAYLIQDDRKLNPPARSTWKSRLVQSAMDAMFAYEARREQRFVRPVDRVVVLDTRNQELFKRHMNKPADVIRSGLDLDKFKPKFEKSNDVFTILETGILFRLRRFEDLIDSAAVLVKRGHKVKVNIIGSEEFDPGYGAELREQVKRLKLENVVNFLGRVSDKELQEQYRNADAFAFPNHNQTWGLAVFEAMASGTPVVVSKTAGAHEVLTDGENALLVDSKQPEQLADQFERLIKDKGLRHKLSRNGREFVEKAINWPLYAQNMMKVFRDVTAK